MKLKVVILFGVLTWVGLSSGARADYHSKVVVATAYNAVPSQTDGSPWVGACGERLDLAKHPIAASPDLFEKGLDCGTEVALEGRQAEYIVEDKMAEHHEGRIDLFMGKNLEQAKAFGERRMRIWWYDDGQ